MDVLVLLLHNVATYWSLLSRWHGWYVGDNVGVGLSCLCQVLGVSHLL